MAEEHFGRMARQLGEVAQILRTQRASSNIKKFGGKREEYRDWIEAIASNASLSGGEDRDRITIAYETSSGLVSKFIGRYLEANDNATWAELKQQLADRFSDVKDSEHALTLLQKSKQNRGETVPLYAERIFQMAREAFPDQAEFDSAPVQRQIIHIFSAGLLSDSINYRILRRKPTLFEEAVDLATKEENLSETFKLRRGARPPPARDSYEGSATGGREETPMEVDAARPRGCFICHGAHRARDCPKRRRTVNAVQQQQPPSQVGAPRGAPEPRRCWVCGSYDHLKRDCPDRRRGWGQPRRGRQEN